MGCGHIGQLLRPVGVEDLPALAVLLQLDLVFQLLAGQVLVHEALAVEVEVQEACIAHDAYAGEVGAAAHVVDHWGVALLHLSTGPHTQLDAVALVGEVALHVHIGEQALDVVLNDLGAEVLEHLGVLGVVAGGEDDALGSVALDVLASGGIAGVEAHAAAIIHDELLNEAAVEGLDIAGVDGFLHIGLDGDVLVGLELNGSGVAGEALLLPVVVLGQRVEDGDDEIVRALVGNSAAGGLGVVQVGVCLHPPVEGVADVVGPLAHDAALAAVGALHHVGVDDVVDLLTGPGVAAPLGLHLAVDDGILAAAALGAVGLLESSHQTAVLGDAAAGGNACDAAAHDCHIHVNGLGDLALVDLRLGTQPVLIGGRCSGVAACGVDAHDGSAGDVVDLGALSSHQGVFQGGGCHAADALGLVGGVNDHVGDGGLAEGHGDLHLTDAGSGAGISAGGVDGLAGRGGGAAGRACVAGGQCAGGNAAHSGSGGNLQEAFTRDLFHLECSLLFLLSTFSGRKSFFREIV